MARRRRQRRRRNSDASFRRLQRAGGGDDPERYLRELERRAGMSGDPFEYGQFAAEGIRQGLNADDVRFQGWALLGMGEWSPGDTPGYYKLATPIRVFITAENGYVRPMDVGSVRLPRDGWPSDPLEFHISNPRSRSRYGGMGLLRVHPPSDKRFANVVTFNHNMMGRDPWQNAAKIEPQTTGAMPKKPKRTKADKATRPIRLGTKRSKAIFDAALGGKSYTLYHNFVPQPLSADYVRNELEADAMRTEKSMRPSGNGQYSIRYHSNHWVEFWSDAEQEVPQEIRETYAPAAPPEPEPEEAAPSLSIKKRRKLIAAIYSATGKDFRSGGRSAPSVMLPVSMGGGLLSLNNASDEELLQLGANASTSGRGDKVAAVLAWIQGQGPEPKRGKAKKAPKKKAGAKAKPPAPAQPAPPPAVAAPAQPAFMAQAELFAPDPEAVAAYQERLEGKRERLEERAAAQRAKSQSAWERSHSGLPEFGQPILVGHHSERRHRAAIKRADAAMRSSIEAQKYASHLESRADAVGTAGISSDDPAAIVKLRQKLASMEARRDRMKAANKAIQSAARRLKLSRKGLRDRAQAEQVLAASGIPEDQQAMLLRTFELTPYHGVGYASYNLTNLGSEIRRTKGRLAELIAEHQRGPAEDVEHEGFYVTEAKDLNRIQLIFEGKPGPNTRKLLKRMGFRWSPRNGAWQRHLNEAGRRAADQVSRLITGEEHGGWLSNPYIQATKHPVLTRASYPGIYQDCSGDGFPDVDSPTPCQPSAEQLEEVSLADEIGHIIDARGQFEARREQLVSRLQATGIPGRIKSRTKTPYSIINKLRRKRLIGPQGLHDIAAAMLVVPSRFELEQATAQILDGALGSVSWFGDYYATPLDGYRARHFTIEVDGLPTELQLKTERMASLGHAAHHAYKTGSLDSSRMDQLSVLADQADQGDLRAAQAFDAMEASGDFGLSTARHNPMARANPERVTFGKMEQWEPGSSEGNIYLDGVDVGSITGDYEDISSGMAQEWRVAAYTAEFWGPGDDEAIYVLTEHVDRDYRGDAIGPGGARGALSRLRKRVRDTLDPKLQRLPKGTYGPRRLKPRKNPMANYHQATVYGRV
jgi:ppGpp synthetase/RelA/SpoT-type nucleotidyltranferase